jgi:hypothetical protein
VEEPEPPLIVVADKEHDSEVEFVVTDNATEPVKPFCGLIVAVEVPVAPAFTLTLEGLADTVNVGALVT